MLSANCTIVYHITIREYAVIRAGTAVNRDVPARVSGWMNACGENLGFPVEGSGEATALAPGTVTDSEADAAAEQRPSTKSTSASLGKGSFLL